MNKRFAEKTLRYFGKVFLYISVLALTIHFAENGFSFEKYGSFSLLNFYFYFVVGVGLFFYQRWAFGVFFVWVKLLYIGFPIGTMTSNAISKRLEEDGVYEYFKDRNK